MLSTTASINIDLQRPSIIVIHAKQFDALSRYAEIHLFSGGEPWAVEGSITYAVQYHKPDGTKGLYDKLPDGETDAVSASTDASGATVLHVRFAPQMFAIAGKVKCSIAMMQSDGTKLQTFSFSILVDQSEVSGDESKDYYKMATLEGLQAAIGDLTNLSTDAKDNLVAAINEVAGKADNAATAAATAQQTADQAATAAGNAATAAATAQQTADQAAGAAAYAVKYRAQDLSASQKKQARKNIGAPEMGVTDVTPEWLAWCVDKGIADADCTENDVFSFLITLSSGVYCLTTGFFGQVWALIYGAYSKHLVAFIEGRVYVEEDTAIYDRGVLAYGGKKAKITDISDSVYEDITSSYEAANTSGTLTPAGYVKSLAKDGKYRIRIGSIGDALFEKMTVDGSKWLFGRSTDGVSVSYTIDRDDTTLLSMSTAGTAKIGDNTVLTDAFIAKPTSADAGKVLTVGAGGNPEWTAVVNAEEVAV